MPLSFSVSLQRWCFSPKQNNKNGLPKSFSDSLVRPKHMLLFIHGHKIYPAPHRLYTIAHCMPLPWRSLWKSCHRRCLRGPPPFITITHTEKPLPLCGGKRHCLLDVCLKKTKTFTRDVRSRYYYLASAVASVLGTLMISSRTISAASPRRGPSLYMRV